MAINSTSFINTPQAGDDIYGWTEDQLLTSGLLTGSVVKLDVLANDLGGSAKRLWSIDDGNGNTSSVDYDLLSSDMQGVWESAASNNLGVADKITISNGAILLDFSASLAKLGAANVNALAATDHIHDEFVYAIRLANGTLSQAKVTVDIWGMNDAATSISGDNAGNLTEDTTTAVTGTLTVIDPDHGESHTRTATNAASAQGFGTYSVDNDGHWSYKVNNAAVQHLSATETATDSFTVTSLDGTVSQVVTIHILGTNDAAVLSADTRNLTETNAATDISTSGTLTISDVDSPTTFVAQAATVGLYGTFAIDSAGAWTYTASSAHNEFVAGTTYSDTFSVASADGTLTSVTINIAGTNDAAVLSSDTKNLTETNAAADISTSGTLTISDVDSPATFVAQAATVGSYGTFAIDSAGAWTYAASSAHNEFAAGSTYTDTFAVASADGTLTSVTLNILGTNDAAVLSADTKTLTETNLAARSEERRVGKECRSRWSPYH